MRGYIAVGLLILAFIVAAVTDGDSPPRSTCLDSDAAIAMAQVFVKRHLKTPATAQFPRGTASYIVSGDASQPCGHNVAGYVDSQNSFGAMIRSAWVARLHYIPADDKWYLDDITIR